jgi:hypothetical protein
MAAITIAAAIAGGALYRLRGGWFSELCRRYGWEWGGKQRTQTMRAIWSIPTAILFAWTLGLSWPIALALVVSTFAGLAVLGHGAHMVFDSAHYVERVPTKGKTEILTGFWLPALFGGIPDSTWHHSRVAAYNAIGMSSIGLARNIITAAPLAFAGEPMAAAIYAASGLLHGPLYWLGWRINGTSHTSEVLVGAASWALIVNL